MVIYYICPRALIRPYLKLLPESFDVLPSTDYVAVHKSSID